MSAATYNPDNWTISSNKAITVAIDENEFHPSFSDSIFGASEQIFGYQNLGIRLSFDPSSMLPLLEFKYSEKLEDDKAEDAIEKLVEVLPKDSLVVNDKSKWYEDSEKSKFAIPGKLVSSYETKGSEYGVYEATLDDLNTLEFHRRIQILVLFLIEAGSYIDEKDPNWTYYFIFEKQLVKFIGFATVYSYWKYPGHAEFDKGKTQDLLFRKKISQFVVLPEFQLAGHGKHLYQALVDQWLKDSLVVEIVVEDPSEQFDDLRDRCDLERLSAQGFISLKNFPVVPIPQEVIEQWQDETKMEKRQLERCVEMSLLHLLIENQNKPLAKKARLQIKRRLYRKNIEVLRDLEAADRQDKLHTAYERLAEDYGRIIEKVRFSNKRTPGELKNVSKKQKK